MGIFLQNLLPKNALFWYPLSGEPHPNGDSSGVVYDYAGAGRYLLQVNNPPIYQTSPPPLGLYFFGTENPLQYTGALVLKHLFCLNRAIFSDNKFDNANRGLVSGLTSATPAILVSQENSTVFFNSGFGAGYQYKKSQIAYPENNQQAAFVKPELVELSYTNGWALDGWQVGRDRDFELRKWIGKWLETIGYARILTQNEINAVNLYYDLKYGLWRLNGTTLNFPNPSITGIPYARFFADNPDYEKITVFHEYEDGGRSFNETSSTAPIVWEVEFDCANYNHAEAKQKSDIFDAFYKQARQARSFNFTDKYGETFTGVRILDYNRSHPANKSWSQNCRFKLVKYP